MNALLLSERENELSVLYYDCSAAVAALAIALGLVVALCATQRWRNVANVWVSEKGRERETGREKGREREREKECPKNVPHTQNNLKIISVKFYSLIGGSRL